MPIGPRKRSRTLRGFDESEPYFGPHIIYVDRHWTQVIGMLLWRAVTVVRASTCIKATYRGLHRAAGEVYILIPFFCLASIWTSPCFEYRKSMWGNVHGGGLWWHHTTLFGRMRSFKPTFYAYRSNSEATHSRGLREAAMFFWNNCTFLVGDGSIFQLPFKFLSCLHTVYCDHYTSKRHVHRISGPELYTEYCRIKNVSFNNKEFPSTIPYVFTSFNKEFPGLTGQKRNFSLFPCWSLTINF